MPRTATATVLTVHNFPRSGWQPSLPSQRPPRLVRRDTDGIVFEIGAARFKATHAAWAGRSSGRITAARV